MTEQLITALICTFLLGALIGAVVNHLVSAEPWHRRSNSDRHRLIKAQAFLAVAREGKPHLGTPYIRVPRDDDHLFGTPTPLPLDVAYALTDPHSGSRRADVLEDRENVVPMQVQTGRPA